MKTRTFFCLLTLLVSGLLSAQATPILHLALDIVPDQLEEGTQVDLPVYLTENRDASETSLFADADLLGVGSSVRTAQSELISFTPIAEFDRVRDVSVSDGVISFYLSSSTGIPLDVDNTGVEGVTRILIGTLRVEIGEPILQDDGVGDPEGNLVLSLDLATKPDGNGSEGNASVRYANGGSKTLGGIFSTAVRIIEPLPEDPLVSINLPPRSTVKTPKIVITGTAADETEIARVEVKVGDKPWARAEGKEDWSFKAKLQPGKNVIKARAIDNQGGVSDVTKVLVIRKVPAK